MLYIYTIYGTTVEYVGSLFFLLSLQSGNETPSGLGLGLIPNLKACLLQCEEDDLQKDKSSRLPQTSSMKPQLEIRSTKNCSPLQDTSVLSSSTTRIKSNLSSESQHRSNASIVDSVENKSKPEAVTDNEQLSTSTFDYELFMTTLPTSKKVREEYLLHEYDRRLKMQIAYQAANFELQDTLHVNNRQFRALIYGQRRFEQRWPLLHRRSQQRVESSTHYAETVAISEKEACFMELIKEGRTLVEVIQFGVHMDDANP